VAARSKVWVCGRSFAGIASPNPTQDVGVSFVSVVCCQVDVSASGWLLVQRSPIECGVSECDVEASVMRWPWSARACCSMGRNKIARITTLQRSHVAYGGLYNSLMTCCVCLKLFVEDKGLGLKVITFIRKFYRNDILQFPILQIYNIYKKTNYFLIMYAQ
jgi:hypothetical protein